MLILLGTRMCRDHFYDMAYFPLGDDYFLSQRKPCRGERQRERHPSRVSLRLSVSSCFSVKSKFMISMKHYEPNRVNPRNNFNRFWKYLWVTSLNTEKKSNDWKTAIDGSHEQGLARISTPRSFCSSEKDMNEKFLKRLEEDQEKDMRQLEDKIRKEVCSFPILRQSPTSQRAVLPFPGAAKI